LKKNIDENPKLLAEHLPNWLQDIDFIKLLEEKRKGVSVKVLYKESGITSVKYWNFWKQLSKLDELVHPKIPVTTMRLKHIPGEKAFVDYTDGINLIDKITNKTTKTQLFVGVLPFSGLIFAEFVLNQKLGSFIESHERMWQAFGGVTTYVVSDNLKSAVTKAHLYDPEINKAFCAYANHAGFAVLPARPYKPKDKASVECHVGLIQRTFYPEVRNKTFQTLGELNQYLRGFIKNLNAQVMKDYGISRLQRFETEASHLKPLPIQRFEVPQWSIAIVHPDCHIQVAKSFYSVPWQHVGKQVRVKSTFKQVEVFDPLSLECIARHTRAEKPGERKTDDLHWPSEKLEHLNFTSEKAKQEAAKVGPHTATLVDMLFSLPQPLQYLRRVQSWIRYVSQGKHSRESMEYASHMACVHRKFSSKYIKDCCDYFKKGGPNLVSINTAPKRVNGANFLHKQPDTSKEST